MRPIRSVLVSLTLLGLSPLVANASSIWVSIASRVERSRLIVSGTLVSDESNKYCVRTYTSGGLLKDTGREYQQRWLHLATLEVDEVLKGTLDHARPDTTADGKIVPTIGVLHDGMIERSDGLFSQISTDQHLEVGKAGVWFLAPGEIRRTYRAEYGGHSQEAIEHVRRCIEVIESNYAGHPPGLPPDDKTWVASWSSGGSMHVDAVPHSDGDVSVFGQFREYLSVSGRKTPLTSFTWTGFLTRIDKDGNVKFTRSIPSESGVSAEGCLTLGDDYIMIGSARSTGSSRGKPGLPDGITTQVARVSPDLDMQWKQTFSGGLPTSDDHRTYPIVEVRLARVSHDGCVFAGVFNGEMKCGNKAVKANEGTDWFVGSLDANGRLRTLHVVPRSDDERLGKVIGDGNRIVFSGSLARPGKDNPQLKTPDVLIGAMTTGGQVAWVDTLGGQWGDWSRDIAVASDGTVFASILVTQDRVGGSGAEVTLSPGDGLRMLGAWSAKGERLWSMAGGGDDIEVGGDGNVYCVGAYGGEWEKGSAVDMPESMGDRDLFLACYRPDGQRLWVRRDGGLSGEMPASLQLLPGNRALIAGGIDGSSFLAGQVVRMQGVIMDGFVMNIPISGPPDESGR